MHFYSTNNTKLSVDVRSAVLQGLAADRGLFMPAEIPCLPDTLIKEMQHMQFEDIALQIAAPFFEDQISRTANPRLRPIPAPVPTHLPPTGHP